MNFSTSCLQECPFCREEVSVLELSRALAWHQEAGGLEVERLGWAWDQNLKRKNMGPRGRDSPAVFGPKPIQNHQLPAFRTLDTTSGQLSSKKEKRCLKECMGLGALRMLHEMRCLMSSGMPFTGALEGVS